MALVELEDFAAYLRDAGLAGGSEGPLLQEHLDAAHEVVATHIGEHGAVTVTAHCSGRSLVLPLIRLEQVVQVRDPLGAVVEPVASELNLLAGIVVVPLPRPGVWKVDVITREATKSAALAVKIIGAHLWSTRRGSAGGSSRNNPALGRNGGDDVVTTGLGYAIPRRAAELLGVESLPALA